MKPMLAKTLGPKFNQYPCFVQPKLNGVRALYQNGVFQSRDEKFWKPGILQHIVDELLHLDIGTEILDGELYVHNWRLQRINGAIAVNRTAPCEDTQHIQYHIFDRVTLNLSFAERWLDFKHKLETPRGDKPFLPHVQVVLTDIATSRTMVDSYFHYWTSLGYEGVILRPDGPYEFGEHWSDRSQGMTSFRSKFLWKHKQWEDGEFVCVGVTQGDGKAGIGIGALICKRKEGKCNCADWGMMDHLTSCPAYTTITPTFKVGTGFDDSERISFMENPPIGKLIRVRYLELTADGIPFNPSFIAVMNP